MRKQFFVFLLLILVSGCGGGGGSSKLNPAAGGLPGPTFTDAQIVPAVNAIIDQSDSFDMIGLAEGSAAGGFSCYDPTRCSLYLNSRRIGTVGLEDIKNSGLDPNLRYSAMGEKNRVKIAQGRGRTSAYGLSVDAENYPGWMDHSAFLLELYTIRSGYIGDINLSGLQFGSGLSIGNDTGSRPLERGATWSGIMWGATYANGSPQILRGDASVSYYREFASLEVLFTEIYNLNTNTKFQDLHWPNVKVSSDGSFLRISSDNLLYMQGRFYGPNHAEVGGSFEYNQQIFGAFGAKRN